MLFNSFEFFLIFLPTVLILFFGIGRRYPNAASLVVGTASLVFLAVWEITYAEILIISILFNYVAANIISSQHSNRNKRVALFLSISANLLTIFLYKYLDFSIDSINGVTGSHIQRWGLLLPLGISFYTFTQTAFLVDTYRNEVKDLNFVRYLLFVTYFPHLIAGPILHHRSIIPQFALASTYHVQPQNMAVGLICFAIGLAKKVVLADSFALYATPIFVAADAGDQVSGVVAWSGALSYTFQIYFDFSGYSDMAVGLAKMMNIDIPNNFNSPYKAFSISDFWRRWHMSLSTFLRDYVYIPLGGSRSGSRHLNLMTTMLVGGLWHGASWTFVFWGGLHGVYLVINHSLSPAKFGWLGRVRIAQNAGRLLTFLAVVLAWTFFRAETFSGALAVISSMASAPFVERAAEAPSMLVQMFHDDEAPWRIALCLTVGFAVSWFAPNTQEIVRFATGARFVPFFVIGAAPVLIFALLMINAARGISEFIYFNF